MRTTLHEKYPLFAMFGLPVLALHLKKYEAELADKFIDFLIDLLPDSVPNSPDYNLDKETFMKMNVNKAVENEWNSRAIIWAHSESLGEYFTHMSILAYWFKKLGIHGDILSVGCGPGMYELFFEHVFRKSLSSIICSDISPDMIEEMKKNKKLYYKRYGYMPRLIPNVSDLEYLEVASSTMHAVICNKMIHWCSNHEKAMDQICRVLRPGGIGVITSGSGYTALTFENGEKHRINGDLTHQIISDYVASKHKCEILGVTHVTIPSPFGWIDCFAVCFKKP